jgi:hypothetical protein
MNCGMSVRAFEKPASVSANVVKNFDWLLRGYEQYKYKHKGVWLIPSFLVHFSVPWLSLLLGYEEPPSDKTLHRRNVN